MSDSPVPVRSNLIPLALCDFAMTSLAIAVNLLPVFLTTLAASFGNLSEEQLGRIGAVGFAGAVTGILCSGPLADRLGGRAFAVGGNCLVAAGLCILGVAPSYQLVLVSAFVMGLGSGCLDMIISPIVAALRPKHRTVAMNVLHSFYCVGAIAMIIFSSIALSHGIGWRMVARCLIPLPFLIGIGFLLIPLPPLVHEDFERTRLRKLIRNPFFIVAIITMFLAGSTELAMAYWVPAYAEKTLRFSPVISQNSLAGFQVGMAAGRLGTLLLPKSIGALKLMFIGCAASVVLFFVAAFSPWSGVALAACILTGLSTSCLWPSTLAAGADHFPHGGATLFAIFAAMGNFGGICAPWFVGFVADHSSLRVGMAVAAIFPVLMMITLALLRWQQKQTTTQGFPVIVEA